MSIDDLDREPAQAVATHRGRAGTLRTRAARGPGQPSDAVLVTRLQRGEPGAFDEIFRRYQGPLLSYCRYMIGNLCDGEDALQQAFIRAHRALVSDSPPRELRPWLYAIAGNCCRSAIAARRPVTDLDEHEPSLAGLSEEVRQREDLRELVGDLQALPEDQRSALLLAELDDLRHEEIAAIVDSRESVSTLRSPDRRSNTARPTRSTSLALAPAPATRAQPGRSTGTATGGRPASFHQPGAPRRLVLARPAHPRKQVLTSPRHILKHRKPRTAAHVRAKTSAPSPRTAAQVRAKTSARSLTPAKRDRPPRRASTKTRPAVKVVRRHAPAKHAPQRRRP